MNRNRAPLPLLMVGLVLVALNLRPVISSFGPLLAQIQAELQVSAATISLLTSVPLLCWGAFALVAPLLLRLRSAEVVILVCLGLIALGGVLRAGPSLPWILGGTVLVGSGIAVVNVLLPSLIRRDFPPERLGLMTGIYTVAVVGGSVIASALAVPLLHAFSGSWRLALGVWSLLAGVGALAWWPAVLGRPPRAAQVAAVTGSVWHNPATLPITLYMGMQSLVFFTWLTWLPKILLERGVSVGDAGLLLSLSTLVQLPFSLSIPVLAARLPSARPVVVGIFLGLVAGVLGLTLLPAWPPIIWIILLGVASGSAFPLALYFMAQRARSAAELPQLSAVAQGLGYLLAACGPVLFGTLHDRTKAWDAPLWLLLGLTVPVLIFGWWAAGEPKRADA